MPCGQVWANFAATERDLHALGSAVMGEERLPLSGLRRLLRLRFGVPPRWQGVAMWLVLIASLAAMYGPSVAEHVRRALDPGVLNDDARQQIYPFYRYIGEGLIKDDYIADYYLANLPILYRGLYFIAAKLGDPVALSKAVPYVLFAVTLGALAAAAARLAGKAAAWGALAIALGASVYLDRMAGGLPRAFGFPLIACALAALVYARPWWLAVLVVLGAGFYPVATAVLGLTLAVWLLVLPASMRSGASDWRLSRRLLFVTAVAIASGAILVPTAVAGAQFGPVIPAHATERFPEAGPGGRYFAADRAPFPGFWEDAPLYMKKGLVGSGEPWVKRSHAWFSEQSSLRQDALFELLVVLVVVGGVGLARRRGTMAAPLMALVWAVLVGHLVARFVAPYLYLPQRYLLYALPLLTALLIPSSVVGICELVQGKRRPWLVPPLVVVLVVGLLAAVGGRGSETAGLGVRVRTADPLYAAVARLPKEAVVAGWPKGPIENVPYISHRAALLTWETHQAFHEGFVLEMRKRMHALTDAYFATSPGPLFRLRDDQGVTHLLVDTRHFRGRKPSYFRPFDERIREKTGHFRPDASEVLRQLEHAAIYRAGSLALLDLRMLTARPPASHTDLATTPP
jgi:hypothetical protein